VLAVSRIPDGHIAVPHTDVQFRLQLLEDVACACLDYWGLLPERFDDEILARNAVERLAREGRWPLLLTPLDTSGEKPFEEFVGTDESVTECGLGSIAALRHVPCGAAAQKLFDDIASWVNDPNQAVAKDALVHAIAGVLPNFRHAEFQRNLDQRL
jgi:hypothetical protein